MDHKCNRCKRSDNEKKVQRTKVRCTTDGTPLTELGKSAKAAGRKPCATCDSRGYTSGYPTIEVETECPKCAGVGQVHYPCKDCGGTGNFAFKKGRKLPCRTCEGTGKFFPIIKDRPRQNTKNGVIKILRGKRVWVIKCGDCAGAGKTMQWKTSSVEELRRCTACNGEGALAPFNPPMRESQFKKLSADITRAAEIKELAAEKVQVDYV